MAASGPVVFETQIEASVGRNQLSSMWLVCRPVAFGGTSRFPRFVAGESDGSCLAEKRPMQPPGAKAYRSALFVELSCNADSFRKALLFVKLAFVNEKR